MRLLSFGPPHFKTNTVVLEWVERRTMKLVRGLESKFHEEQLRELSVFSLVKRCRRGDILTLQLPEKRL